MIGPTIYGFSANLSPNLSTPMMIVGRLGREQRSCATGYNYKTLMRSAGEAMKRQMSFARRQPACKARLNTLDIDLANWFRGLFWGPIDVVDNHQFEMVEVFDTDLGKNCFAPAVCFTLGISPDDAFFPNRDSSGTALHQTREASKSAALCEFAERQSLTAFWYNDYCNTALEIDKLNINYLPESARRIARFLINTGRVMLFNISIFSSFHSMLAVFLSPDAQIKFASGASSSGDMTSAIDKSLVELYHAYSLMGQLVGAARQRLDIINGSDPIMIGYLNHNSIETANKFIRRYNKYKAPWHDFNIEGVYLRPIESVRLLINEIELKFPASQVFQTSVHGINSFPRMSLFSENSIADDLAAKAYGFSFNYESGDIPFA